MAEPLVQVELYLMKECWSREIGLQRNVVLKGDDIYSIGYCAFTTSGVQDWQG